MDLSSLASNMPAIARAFLPVAVAAYIVMQGRFNGGVAAVINAINSVHSNVWSVLLIAAAVSLILNGHPNEGSILLTGAFAVFRSESGDKNPTQGQ